MSLMGRFVQKKLYLPLKWRMERWAEAYSVSYPHPSVLQARIEQLEEDRLTALRNGNKDEALLAKGAQEGIKFVLEYGKDEGSA